MINWAQKNSLSLQIDWCQWAYIVLWCAQYEQKPISVNMYQSSIWGSTSTLNSLWRMLGIEQWLTLLTPYPPGDMNQSCLRIALLKCCCLIVWLLRLTELPTKPTQGEIIFQDLREDIASQSFLGLPVGVQPRLWLLKQGCWEDKFCSILGGRDTSGCLLPKISPASMPKIGVASPSSPSPSATGG